MTGGSERQRKARNEENIEEVESQENKPGRSHITPSQISKGTGNSESSVRRKAKINLVLKPFIHKGSKGFASG